MQKHPDSVIIPAIRIMAQARANEIAYKMGKISKHDKFGKFVRFFGEGFCFLLGLICRPFVEKKFGDWLEIYDPEIR